MGAWRRFRDWWDWYVAKVPAKAGYDDIWTEETKFTADQVWVEGLASFADKLKTTKPKKIYLLGALKNRAIMDLGERLRAEGFEVFDDWLAPGPEADAFLLEYEKNKGHGYKEALKSHAAVHVFEFDKGHIDSSDIGIMVMPAGKSAHLELGYMRGQGKPSFVVFDEEPERFDVMYQFATDVFFDVEELVKTLESYK